MQTLYLFVGRFVIWALTAGLLGAGCYYGYRALPTRWRGIIEGAILLIRILLGYRALFPKEGAYLLLSALQRHQPARLMRWERDMAAFMIRYSHRKGWKQPT